MFKKKKGPFLFKNPWKINFSPFEKEMVDSWQEKSFL